MITKYDEKIAVIKKTISTLLSDITKADELSLEAFRENNSEKFKEVDSLLNNLAAKGDMIDNEIIKTFALYGPEAKELRFLISYLKMTNEIVRIGEGVKKYAKRMSLHITDDCQIDSFKSSIILLHKSSINALRYILECFDSGDDCLFEDTYRKVVVEESMNDDLFNILEKEILNKIIDEKEVSVEYVKLLSTLRKLERACDRGVNIANLLLYAHQGGEINTQK